MIHKVYAADAMRLMNNSIAHTFGGSLINKRFYDLITDEEMPDEERTEAEIRAQVFDMIERATK